MRLDLETLDRALSRPDAAEALNGALEGLGACADPGLATRIANTPAEDLMLDVDDAGLIHPEMWARLNGSASIYDHPCLEAAFHAASRAEPNLERMLRRLRRSVTGLKDGLRRGGGACWR